MFLLKSAPIDHAGKRKKRKGRYEKFPGQNITLTYMYMKNLQAFLKTNLPVKVWDDADLTYPSLFVMCFVWKMSEDQIKKKLKKKK